MRESIYKFVGCGVVLIVCIVCSLPALAQEREEKQGNEYTLAPVTVSAQKREENLEKVPVSVDVLDDVTLEESHITQFTDIQSIVPGLYTSTTGGTGTYSFISIRGRNNGTLDVDPTVTVLVDDVPYDDFYAVSNNLLFDIERVEVLRGPQSTLYGLNSEAGVINIITKQPSDTRRIKLFGEGSFGDRWDGSYTAGASVSGPIFKDILNAGISFMSKGQGGYVLNQRDDKRFNSSNTTGVRGNFVLTPDDAWTISGGLSYTNLDADSGYIFLPYDDSAAHALGQEHEDWETDVDYEGESDMETVGANLKINYQLDSLGITTVSAFRHTDQEFSFDGDLTPVPLMFGLAKCDVTSFTQEVRVQSAPDTGSPLEWTAGYFFHYFDRGQKMGYGYGSLDAFSPYYDTTLNGTSHAVFGQGTYRFLNRKLGLTVGLRQEWTEREAEDLNKAYYGNISTTDSIFLPKFALDYRLAPEAMVYASVTKGWRSGGVNNFSSSANQVKYDKETCWAYEIGAKTNWLNRRLLINVSAYYTVYEDYLDAVRTSFMTQYLSNVPEVRMWGFETELSARLTEHLGLNGGFGYVNAKYEDFPDPVAGDYDGNTVSMVPDFDANLALRYDFLEHFYVRPEVRAVGNLYWDRENNKKQDPYLTLNLRAGYTWDNYEIYLYGQNLTNEYSFVYAVDYMTDGNYYGTPITPLCVGMGVSIHL